MRPVHPFPPSHAARPARRPLPLGSLLLLSPLLVLSACGGGGGGGGSGDGVVVVPTPPVVPPSLRGKLIGTASVVPVSINGASVNTLEPAVFKQFLDDQQRGSSNITGTPSCAVTTYTVKYHTVGSAGEDTEASTAIMVPSGGTAGQCGGARPVLLYAHGTSVLKANDMSKLSATEPRLVAAMFAAQGYIVVAPNYAGYAGSTLGYHAYLDALQQSSDMVDGLRAARLSFAAVGAKDGGRLLLTGYSQGGYVALATQRAMQSGYAGEFNVTAAAGLSGPYALSLFGDSIFGGAPSSGAAAFLPMLINAGQRANAGLYSSSAEVYEAKYASGIDSLFPGALGIGDLVAAGKLPNDVLFAQDSLPQAAGYAASFGADHLFKTSYRDGYLADLRATPCNASNANPLGCAPAHPLRKWLLKNDLRNYLPAVPLLLCGGDQDPVVPYKNAEAAYAYFAAQGKPAGTLSLLNVDATASLGDYADTQLAFGAAKGVLRLSALLEGKSASQADQAVRDSYHAGLVAPFCLRATRDFFGRAANR
ncbi:alpha/beta hydrolase family protein [Rugamonas rubra]|uniref:Alpha/beta hydrolase family protein n=1 Tax=Rugamonas rubra TaxID=758825 RepID=A0A1I4HLT9_9BURK|nr:lipase family protein [Rugamonas rubra]SFL42386.1 Alpha/beta hydrolase family protein [Rugamonas rubra]